VTSVLVTGSSGFIGRRLVSRLGTEDFRLTCLSRSPVAKEAPGRAINASLEELITVPEHFEGIDCVIHLAGRAHVLKDAEADPLTAFRKTNRDLSVELMRCAINAGVKRFVFISSIGVNGASTSGQPFSELSAPAPHAAYALSKLEAELELSKLAASSTIELVIIRPPMVYGADAPGNFQRLLKLVSSGIPLPFASVYNTRSMVALDNLVDFIALCVKHPAAANELFLVSDGTDVSTADIVRHLGEGMGRKVRLLPVPPSLMRIGAALLGRQAMYTQLCGSLAIDSRKARELLGWRPGLTAEAALVRSGQEFAALANARN